MDINNDKFVIDDGKSELSQALKRLEIEKYANNGQFASTLVASSDIRDVLEDHEIRTEDLTVESLCRLYRLVDFALREADDDGIDPVGLMATTMRLCFFPEGDFRHAIFRFGGAGFCGEDARVSIGSELDVSVDVKLFVCDRFHIVVFAFAKWAEEIEESRGDGASSISSHIAGKALSFMERVGR